MNAETLIGTAVSHDGKILKTVRGTNVRQLISLLDASHANCHSASIRGEYTSDGTHWGEGKGRVVALREPRMLDGAFYSGWIVY